ncbi:helix-turn-helix domain-containing protein [Dyadobacter beijingensis]|nr:helix-turn-helix transcriptional regulator [Dyadobacter beijingensis]
MKEREQLLRSPIYWLTHLQIEIFNLLNTYMEENNLTPEQVSEKLDVPPFYVSQILNGNFNFKLSKLVELSLLVGKAPIIRFETIEHIMENEKKIRRDELARNVLDCSEAFDSDPLE